ncbi:MAG: MarR family transcriptional regulator [Clostridium sp.]|nr:MarR family transcriptional regulator [Clostridium sp.]
MEEKVRLSLLLKMVNNVFERELNNKSYKIGLTSTQCRIIGFLDMHRDKLINPIDIEREFCLKRPTVTGVLKRLEEKGFVKISQNFMDKRYKEIKLTNKADKLIENMRENLFQTEKILYKNLTKVDKEELYRILKIMLDNFELKKF